MYQQACFSSPDNLTSYSGDIQFPWLLAMKFQWTTGWHLQDLIPIHIINFCLPYCKYIKCWLLTMATMLQQKHVLFTYLYIEVKVICPSSFQTYVWIDHNWLHVRGRKVNEEWCKLRGAQRRQQEKCILIDAFPSVCTLSMLYAYSHAKF